MAFDNLNALIIDMDGVLWEGNRSMPGLVDFFQTLRQRRLPFVLATNNASRTPQQYLTKLAQMGVAVRREEVIGSGLAAAMYLEHHAPAGAKVFAIGEDGVTEALLERGFRLAGLYEKDADYVVCGMDRGISWDKLATATLNIRNGARFIATNTDTTLPTEHGTTHGNGAIVAALIAAGGVQPTVIGKPEPIMYQMAMERLQVPPEQTIAIGDRLETDILGAVRAGIRSVMVLTGISSRADIEAADYGPTWVMEDIREITAALG